jgi:very-short-patch-repair endonuclease
LQAKPVFMMSPLSIANFLPPGAIEFDVVIFDEASQVKTVDAFGAILRGKQVIVVGDTQQMPPTNFFGRDVDIDDEENITSDIESILSMFKYAGAQERYLRWHYRSRHESLIAVSNVEFYERKLMVFPSPGRNLDATGLHLRHLPTALYDRGRTRTNKGEAQAVAQAVIDHARSRPHQSLGVVAFSMVQRDAIQMEVELLSRQEPELAAFFNARESEPFFVKNLENVQGDERDVIYISIGYGRNESGKIGKHFGPVTQEGGHRRLNVLITRAKLAMEVFCNFRSADLELDANATHGVRALKNFLHYAETGDLAIATETGKDVDSPFELEVMTALVARGYQIEPQIGSAGYFIDLGVKDPDAPGRYILAIECDGAAYHSSRSARDRDRLRQGVLEGLGWRFHRIWSTDWFRNPGQELERVIDAIETARIALPAIITGPQRAIVIERAPTPAEQPVAAPPAYRKAQLPPQNGVLQEEKEAFIIDLISQVLDVEAPIHQDELTRRLMDAYGLKRMGTKIEAVLGAAIATGAKRKLMYRHDSFIYLNARREAVVRNRTDFAAAEKKIELVAPEELDMALLNIVRSGFSMTLDAAVSGALELLGFGRATARIGGAVQARIDTLLASGRLKLEDARLVPGEGKHGVARTA